MGWTRFLLAVVLSGLATTFTDWLFMGALFHKKYLDTPEIWRIKPGQNDSRSILASSLLGLSSCAAFLYLCVWIGPPYGSRATLPIAFLIWLAAPVPIIFSNIVWIKMHLILGISHSLGWLARFVVTSLIGGWLLR